MGVDVLDLKFKIERQFSVRIDRDALFEITHYEKTGSRVSTWDIQVGELVSLVGAKVHEQNPAYDKDVFQDVRPLIAECLQVDETEVTPEAWLVRDLGMA